MKQSITILGSTGSIGTQSLDIIRQHEDRYCIEALTAKDNAALLFEQCCEFKPKFAVLVNPSKAESLRQQFKNEGLETQLLIGEQALMQVAEDQASSIVIAAIVGAAGLLPTLAAVKVGKKILLANKEPLVMAGELFMQAAKEANAMLLPVDSEHNAIFQCLPDDFLPGQACPQVVKNITLTASGGPFLQSTFEQLQHVTPSQAVKHPNWEMGKKISVDSATMMNKGLEVIEAYWLFALSREQIKVVIHPQSIVHSLVHYCDGSFLAQLSEPDMRIPIANALAWPDRIKTDAPVLDLINLKQLDFLPVEESRYPCLELAYQALAMGGVAPAALNAANEEAVAAFLDGRIGFMDIANVVADALRQVEPMGANNLENVLEQDRLTRHHVRYALAEKTVA